MNRINRPYRLDPMFTIVPTQEVWVAKIFDENQNEFRRFDILGKTKEQAELFIRQKYPNYKFTLKEVI